eukprot:Gb_04429 [translate_table: standard]
MCKTSINVFRSSNRVESFETPNFACTILCLVHVNLELHTYIHGQKGRPHNLFALPLSFKMNALLLLANSFASLPATSSRSLFTVFLSPHLHFHIALAQNLGFFFPAKKAGQIYLGSQKYGNKGRRVAVLDLITENKYSKIEAQSTGSLSATELLSGI